MLDISNASQLSASATGRSSQVAKARPTARCRPSKTCPRLIVEDVESISRNARGERPTI